MTQDIHSHPATTSPAVGRVPDTFLVGAPKSGTTYLADWLASTPDVYVPPVKEPGFFMEDHQYRRGLEHCASRYYSGAGDEPVVVDATPWYLYPASVPTRIAEAVGPERARIVVVLREPVARAVSMYHDQAGRRRERRSMTQAFADDLAVADPDAEVAGEAGPDLFRHYVLCGRYAAPIRRYLDTFGAGSVCVLLAEELWSDPESVRARLTGFLGVPLPPAPERVSNPASVARLGLVETLLSRAESSRSVLRDAVARHPELAGRIRAAMDRVARANQAPGRYPPPDTQLRAALAEWFAPLNAELEQVIGRSLEAWR